MISLTLFVLHVGVSFFLCLPILSLSLTRSPFFSLSLLLSFSFALRWLYLRNFWNDLNKLLTGWLTFWLFILYKPALASPSILLALTVPALHIDFYVRSGRMKRRLLFNDRHITICHQTNIDVAWHNRCGVAYSTSSYKSTRKIQVFEFKIEQMDNKKQVNNQNLTKREWIRHSVASADK